MPNTRQIRQQIRSVSNTARITSAMELIAGAKMRRAQQRVVEARPYSEKLIEVLAELTQSNSESLEDLHPFLEEREQGKFTVIQFTPNRGLCGGLNSNLNKTAYEFYQSQDGEGSFISAGKKGKDYISRRNVPILGEYSDLGDFPSPDDLLPLSSRFIEDYLNKDTDKVYLVYAQFVNTGVQKPVVKQLLPIAPDQFLTAKNNSGRTYNYEYEPDVNSVLGSLLPRYIEMQVYQAALENAASEQSARMVAMRSATDAAGEMMEDLNLKYNKARQETITSELLDLVGGVAALENK